MPVEFIYFDLGNVICFFDREREIRQVCEVSGVSKEKAWDAVLGPEGILWRYETGELNDQQYYEEFCRRTDTRPDMAALLYADADIFTLNFTLLPLIAQLEDAQVPLGILSNTSPAHWRVLNDGRYGILPGAFKTMVLSFEVGAIKPAEKMYERAIEMAGVPADRIFYVDDLPLNVEGARGAGIDAVQYTATDLLAQELLKRGVRCNF